jgi:hypothetical protein
MPPETGKMTTNTARYVWTREPELRDRCGGCGLLYVHDSDTDRALHRREHARRTAGWRLPRNLRADDPVVTDSPEITVRVDYDASAQWRTRAACVARLVNREVGYDFPLYDAWRTEWDETFAYQRQHRTTVLVAYDPADRRAVGLLVFQFSPVHWRMCWRAGHELGDDMDGGLTAGNHALEVVEDITGQLGMFWTVVFVWTHRRARRRGLASRLLNIAANHVGIPVDGFAWLHPFSCRGAAFARRVCPAEVVVA